MNLLILSLLGLLPRSHLAQLSLETLNSELQLLFATPDFVFLCANHHQGFQVAFLSVAGPSLLVLGLMLELLFALLDLLLLSFEFGLGHFVEGNLAGIDKAIRVFYLVTLVVKTVLILL